MGQVSTRSCCYQTGANGLAPNGLGDNFARKVAELEQERAAFLARLRKGAAAEGPAEAKGAKRCKVLNVVRNSSHGLHLIHASLQVSPEHVIPVLIAKQAPKEEGERVFDAMTTTVP